MIETYLPAGRDDAALLGAVADAIASTGAAGPKDMGRVMAALRASHGAELDMARANAIVRKTLG